MTLTTRLAAVPALSARLLDPLQPLLAAGLRLHVGWQFFKSGLAKAQDWDATLFLFQEEYRVPLLSPQLAALAGTAGELILPLLLWAGLATRLSALGLFALNLLAVVSYAHVLLQPGFEGAVGQHVLWGLMLAVTAVYGPGQLSLDAWLATSGASRPGLVAGRP